MSALKIFVMGFYVGDHGDRRDYTMRRIVIAPDVNIAYDLYQTTIQEEIRNDDNIWSQIFIGLVFPKLNDFIQSNDWNGKHWIKSNVILEYWFEIIESGYTPISENF